MRRKPQMSCWTRIANVKLNFEFFIAGIERRMGGKEVNENWLNAKRKWRKYEKRPKRRGMLWITEGDCLPYLADHCRHRGIWIVRISCPDYIGIFFIGYYNLIECSFIKTPHYHSKFMVIPPREMLLIYCGEVCFTVFFSNKSYPLAVVRFRIWGGRNCP